MIELYGVFYNHNIYVANSPTNHHILIVKKIVIFINKNS